jgi:hypothetical protein
MKLSATLRLLLSEYADRALPLGILIQRTGEQGFGMVSGILVFPLLIPIPIPIPGFSTIFGAGIILLGLQLAIGYHQPYLPDRLAKIELSPTASKILVDNLQKIVSPIERLVRARLLRISRHPIWHRFAGLCMAWDAALMALPLPIPFTNILPAYSILFLSIGMLELDGLFILIGYAMTTATTIFFGSIAGAIWTLIKSWF